jgi:hypothetical protein
MHALGMNCPSMTVPPKVVKSQATSYGITEEVLVPLLLLAVDFDCLIMVPIKWPELPPKAKQTASLDHFLPNDEINCLPKSESQQKATVFPNNSSTCTFCDVHTAFLLGACLCLLTDADADFFFGDEGTPDNGVVFTPALPKDTGGSVTANADARAVFSGATAKGAGGTVAADASAGVVLCWRD